MKHRFVGDHPALAEKIWDTIAEILEANEYREITARY
jgi:hypothetical protein